MADKSTFWANAVINTMRGTGITAFTGYVSLHTADPGLTGASEVTGGSYARQSVTFNAPSGGVTANSNTLSFTSMPAVTVTHVGLWNASSAGSFVYGDILSNGSQVVNSGGTFEIAAGDLDLTEA